MGCRAFRIPKRRVRPVTKYYRTLARQLARTDNDEQDARIVRQYTRTVPVSQPFEGMQLVSTALAVVWNRTTYRYEIWFNGRIEPDFPTSITPLKLYHFLDVIGYVPDGPGTWDVTNPHHGVVVKS